MPRRARFDFTGLDDGEVHALDLDDPTDVMAASTAAHNFARRRFMSAATRIVLIHKPGEARPDRARLLVQFLDGVDVEAERFHLVFRTDDEGERRLWICPSCAAETALGHCNACREWSCRGCGEVLAEFTAEQLALGGIDGLAASGDVEALDRIAHAVSDAVERAAVHALTDPSVLGSATTSTETETEDHG